MKAKVLDGFAHGSGLRGVIAKGEKRFGARQRKLQKAVRKKKPFLDWIAQQKEKAAGELKTPFRKKPSAEQLDRKRFLKNRLLMLQRLRTKILQKSARQAKGFGLAELERRQ